MVDRETVRSRLERLARALQGLRRVRERGRDAFIASDDLQAIAERNLIVAIQCILDIANHLASAEGWGSPETYEDALRTLAEKRAMPSAYRERIRGLAGLRNILIHEYLRIDPGRVWDAVERIDDLAEFARYVEPLL